MAAPLHGRTIVMPGGGPGIERAVATAVDRFGGVDIRVDNAGALNPGTGDLTVCQPPDVEAVARAHG
jgi:NAD(P)-dependent dehydrogenase (short-subunit alcohol dehydrogenase family)